MNLGIFLPIGSSFQDLKKSGQDKRFINYYLKKYNQAFARVYIFSYKNEKVKLPFRCFLAGNKHHFHRFFYSFLLVFFNRRIIKKIDVFRVMQMTGVIPAILTKIFFKKPFIFTYGYNYSALARLEAKKVRVILLNWLEGISVKFSSGIITTNKRIKSYLEKRYPQTKIFYLPNGIDTAQFKIQTFGSSSGRGRSKFKVTKQNSKIKILSVARLERQKNLDGLIKAVALLKDKYKIQITFIGQGKLKVQLIKLAKNLRVNLRIIDRVPHGQLAKYYQQTDIFCLPSFLEGQPKALLEAMACALSCLVGQYPGVEEFKNREEILTTGFKVKDIARNLEELIKDINLRKKISLNARRKIIKDFNINTLLDKEIKILRSG
jgi:glycosyltransferase involved in cell wall biosynthesis